MEKVDGGRRAPPLAAGRGARRAARRGRRVAQEEPATETCELAGPVEKHRTRTSIYSGLGLTLTRWPSQHGWEVLPPHAVRGTHRVEAGLGHVSSALAAPRGRVEERSDDEGKMGAVSPLAQARRARGRDRLPRGRGGAKGGAGSNPQTPALVGACVRGSARWPIGGRERTTTVVLLVSTEAKRQREPSPPRTKRSGCLLGGSAQQRTAAEEVQERKKPRGANGRQHIVPRRIHGRAPTGGGLERERQSSNAHQHPARVRHGLCSRHVRSGRPDA